MLPLQTCEGRQSLKYNALDWKNIVWCNWKSQYSSIRVLLRYQTSTSVPLLWNYSSNHSCCECIIRDEKPKRFKNQVCLHCTDHQTYFWTNVLKHLGGMLDTASFDTNHTKHTRGYVDRRVPSFAPCLSTDSWHTVLYMQKVLSPAVLQWGLVGRTSASDVRPRCMKRWIPLAWIHHLASPPTFGNFYNQVPNFTKELRKHRFSERSLSIGREWERPLQSRLDCSSFGAAPFPLFQLNVSTENFDSLYHKLLTESFDSLLLEQGHCDGPLKLSNMTAMMMSSTSTKWAKIKSLTCVKSVHIFGDEHFWYAKSFQRRCRRCLGPKEYWFTY